MPGLKLLNQGKLLKISGGNKISCHESQSPRSVTEQAFPRSPLSAFQARVGDTDLISKESIGDISAVGSTHVGSVLSTPQTSHAGVHLYLSTLQVGAVGQELRAVLGYTGFKASPSRVYETLLP